MATDVAKDDWVFQTLGYSVPGGEAEFAADLDDLGLDVSDIWKAARTAFQTASEMVDGQISALQNELKQSDDTELQDIAEFGLNGITDNTRVPLLAALQEAGVGSQQALKSAAPKIEKAAGAFLSHLSSDPRVIACDQNPFGVDVAIVGTYQDAIEQLIDAARTAQAL